MPRALTKVFKELQSINQKIVHPVSKPASTELHLGSYLIQEENQTYPCLVHKAYHVRNTYSN